MNLIKFPEPEKNSNTQSVSDLLEEVKAENLTRVLICGYGQDGFLYVKAANLDIHHSYFLVGQTTEYILSQGKEPI